MRDGWIREMQNFHVLIKGTIVPLLVAFSMDQITVRLPEEFAPGDQVTPIGRDGEKKLRAKCEAADAGPHYEVVCLLE